jgi:hypothetical protein
MGDFTTAGEVESVTAHEVINIHGKTSLGLGQLGQLSCFIRLPDGNLPAEE